MKLHELEGRLGDIQTDNDELREVLETVRQDLAKLQARVGGMEQLAKIQMTSRPV